VALTCATACQPLALPQLNGRSDSHPSGARGAMYVERVRVVDGGACATNRSKCAYDAIGNQVATKRDTVWVTLPMVACGGRGISEPVGRPTNPT
jgi:hypothetical protein